MRTVYFHKPSGLTTSVRVVTESPAPARQRLLEAAEQLIGEQGVSASLREVSSAAGQRNTSAVQYHFGNRNALIEAVVDLRQRPLEAARLAMLGARELQGDVDIIALIEILVTPMFEVPYEAGATHYARFLEKVRDHPVLASKALDEHEWPATKLLVARIAGLLDNVPGRLIELRLRSMMSTMFALLADAERAAETAGGRPDPQLVGALVDMLVGLLTGPHRHRSTTDT